MLPCPEFDLHTIEIPSLPCSTWPKILGSVGAPSSAELIAIRNVVHTAQSRLSQLMAEIERVVELSFKLARRLDEFSKFIDEHNALLVPVRRLPTELLSEIFCHYVSTSSEANDFLSSRQKLPFVLGNVCRYWRTIVLSTPEIWSTVRVDFSPRNSERRAAVAKTWLSKSGTYPLSLKLREIGFSAEGTHPVIDAIIPYCGRLQHLNADISPEMMYAFTSNEDTFPALQSLELSICVRYWDEPSEAWRAFQNAPMLRRVFFHNVFQPSTIKLPWTQLTDISFDTYPMYPEECLAILKMCPSLKSCAFHNIDGPYLNPFFDHPPVLHSHLRSLQVQTHLSLSKFFDCLKLPALCDIHVGHDSGHPQFISLLARSSCRVKRFVVDTKLTLHHFIKCLEHMSELAELHIKTYTTSHGLSRLLQRLTLVGNQDVDLCPQLRVIRLSNDPPVDSQILMTMLDSRTKEPRVPYAANFRSIYISSRNPPADLQQTEPNRFPGVHVFITKTEHTTEPA